MANTGAGLGRLKGRKDLITGAASGIGHAAAVLFAEEGAQIALFDVKDVSSWDSVPSGALAMQKDLLDRGALPKAVVSAADKMGGLDGIVNCAGIGAGCPLAELELDLWDRAFGVNVTAPYLICKAALPYLKQAPGVSTIVNIASGAAVLPTGPTAAYSASKGALVSLTKALAKELAPEIRVNTIMPGVVDTEMTATTVFKDYANKEDAPFLQLYALKRVGAPREIATAILFLTSSDSSFVTGANLAVDAGRTYH